MRSGIFASGLSSIHTVDQLLRDEAVDDPMLPVPQSLESKEFPPNDVLYTLVDLFFKHINTWMPLLERKQTFATFFGSTYLNDDDKLMLHAIVVTTLRFVTDARLTVDLKQRYYRASRHHVELYTLKSNTVATLKALALLSLDSFGTSQAADSWNSLSMLANNILRLNLCTERSSYISHQHAAISPSHTAVDEPTSWLEDEGNRRLCWVVYVLDRYATVDTPYDFTLPERAMKRWLPCRYDLWSENVPVETGLPGNFERVVTPSSTGAATLQGNLGSFSLHCDVLHILSRIHDFVKTPLDIHSEEVNAWQETFEGFQAELSSWLQRLPGEQAIKSRLCHSDPAARTVNWIMLHAAFVTATIRLHSVVAYPAARFNLFAPSHSAAQTCLSAVDSLANITIELLESDNMSLLGPQFASALWISAKLLIVHAANGDEIVIDPKIDMLVHVLSQIGRYWPVSSTYSDLLSRAIERVRTTSMNLAEMRE